MPDRKASRAFRAFEAILDQKAIPAAKALREMSAPRDLRDRQDLPDRLGLKATSVFQAHEAFRGRPEQPVPPDPWVLKASQDRRAFKVSQDQLEPRARKDVQEIPDLREQPGRPDQPALTA